MRVAVYARHSSQKQVHSTRDQIARCVDYCDRLGYRVVDVFRDESVSGEYTTARDELEAMMIAALEGSFERVVAEDLSRLSRGRNDVSHLYKKLKFVGVGLETVAEGPIADIHVGFKGAMNEMFLRDLADKTLRGNIASVLRGNVPGGVTYGYRRARVLDARGELVRGRCAIVPEQAAVVRDIFAWFVDGLSPGGIAAKLNGMGVPAPGGGGLWRISGIVGSDSRWYGILRNTLYRGEVTFNRVTYCKDPDTGRRIARSRPREEWVRVPIPELRIVDDDVFAGALAIVEDRAARRDERRKLLASRSRPERRAEHRRQIRDWRLARRKETGRVCALFARRLYCSVHKRALRRDGDVYACPASKTCANRGLTIGLLTALCAAAAKALTADDLAAWHAGAAVEARRARLRAEIAGAEARFADWHRKTTEAVAALGAGNPPQALREWCAVNEDKMRQARLDAAWGRIALERLAPPSNPEWVVGKFKDLVRRWEADPRDPDAVTRLRHAMKRFTIVPGPAVKRGKRRFRIEIDYDFEAMVKVFGPPRKVGRRPGSETAKARRERG